MARVQGGHTDNQTDNVPSSWLFADEEADAIIEQHRFIAIPDPLSARARKARAGFFSGALSIAAGISTAFPNNPYRRWNFDSIPKQPLLAMVGQKVADHRILALVEAFLEQGVMDGAREWTPEEGTPQAAVVAVSEQYLAEQPAVASRAL